MLPWCPSRGRRPVKVLVNDPPTVVAEAAHLHRSSVSGDGRNISNPAPPTPPLRALCCRSCLERLPRAGGRVIINERCLSLGWKAGLRISDNSVAFVLGTNPAGCPDASLSRRGRMMKEQEGESRGGRHRGRRDFHVRTMEKWPLRSSRTVDLTPDLQQTLKSDI